MAAVGNAVLDAVARPPFLAGVVERGQHLQRRLSRLVEKHGLAGERGAGLLRALDLGRPIGAMLVEAARALQPKGLLLNSPRPHLLRFMPALNVPFADIDLMVDQLDRLLAAAA
jgi:acetylornithine/N-succinyldiaminopimelate aminotransferase